jgi:hypothetical protein
MERDPSLKYDAGVAFDSMTFADCALPQKQASCEQGYIHCNYTK